MATATDKVRSYRTDGYVEFGALTSQEVADVLADANHLERTAVGLYRSSGDFNLEAPGGGFTGQDGTKHSYSGVLRKVSNAASHSSAVAAVSKLPSITNLVRILLGTSDFRLVHSVLWFKPPRVGSPKPPHQDAAYLGGHPEHYLTVWIALDDCRAENGCLQIVPGSHLGGAVPHIGSEARVADQQWSEQASALVPLSPGRAIAFHPYLWHASGANHSASPRRALTLRYVEAQHRRD